jgi:hypothetical protein
MEYATKMEREMMRERAISEGALTSATDQTGDP